MQCKDVMTRAVQWIPPDETVSGAAKLMNDHNVGFLPVCNPEGVPIGVVTDRDIALRVVGEDRSTAVTNVREVMSLPVQIVRADTSLDRLREIMTNEGISRLVVVDDRGHLTGVVTLNDMLVHDSGHLSLDTVRGLYAKQARPNSKRYGRIATAPQPEYFRGTPEPDMPIIPNPPPENSARLESENVAHGGTNPLKEFPA